MQTLEKYRQKRLAAWAKVQDEARHGRLMNVECPTCKAELRMDMTMMLTSNPPQRCVFCSKCDFRTSVVC